MEKGEIEMLDLQTQVDYITQVMYIVTPIIIIFLIVTKITNWFMDFVNGNRRVKL